MERKPHFERLRVLFLILDNEAPSSRYRVLQYLPYLQGQGIEPVVEELGSGRGNRWMTLWRARSLPVVFVQKRPLRPLEQWLMGHGMSKIVFDFDDAIIYRDSAKGGTLSLRRLSRFRRMIRNSHVVIAGNGYLKDLAEPGSRRVVVIPTPIDMQRYTQKAPLGLDTIRIGWIGGRGTLFYLEQLEPVLREVCSRLKGVTVKVISDAFPRWEGIPLERKQWIYGEEIADLHSLDIGIMPLTDDPWSRGKCGFKLLQYMAVGLPVVCSPVGVNSEIVKDGETGLLARDARQWITSLEILIKDREMRRKLGEAARQKVMAQYSLDRWAARMAALLWEVSGKQR